jgi:hypothetical protein
MSGDRGGHSWTRSARSTPEKHRPAYPGRAWRCEVWPKAAFSVRLPRGGGGERNNPKKLIEIGYDSNLHVVPIVVTEKGYNIKNWGVYTKRHSLLAWKIFPIGLGINRCETLPELFWGCSYLKILSVDL